MSESGRGVKATARTGLTWILLVTLGSLAVASRAAETERFDPSRLRWRSLHYRVSKFGLSVTSRIDLKPQSASEVAAELVELGQPSGLLLEGQEGRLLTMDTRTFHREGELSLWFDPTTGTALQRSEVETGKRLKRNRYRVLRFADSGFHSRIYRPAETEVDKPAATWSQRSESFVAYPAGCCAAVGTPSLLFYLLSVGDLSKPGDRVQVHLVSKSRLFLVQLVAEAYRSIRVSYLQESSEGRREVTGYVTGLEVSLVGKPLAEDLDDEGFEFLGLRDDVRLVLDRELRIPLEISGSIRYAGRGHVRLQAVALE